MEIVKLSVNTPGVFEKVERYKAFFVDELPNYFEMKDYGEGVKKITYIEFLLPDDLKDDASMKHSIYDEEKKSISCTIEPQYQQAVRININKFGLFIAEYYLRESAQLTQLRIRKFDVTRYVEDLEKFFRIKNLM